MPSKPLVMNLAKLMVAAAWLDGKLDDAETDALKDLMFTLPDMTANDWTVLSMYVDSPVGGTETRQLLDDVVREIHSAEDKQFVAAAIKRVVEADGKVTEEEMELLEYISAAMHEKKSGFVAQLGEILSRAVKKRSDNYAAGVHREARIDDYIRNSIYFQLVSVLETAGIRMNLTDEQLRKLCLAAGMMARVAWVDESLTDEERHEMQHVLAENWGLTDNESALVAALSCSKIMKGLDYFRLSRSFYECTGEDERKNFLKSLFHIANSSGRTSHREIEEIRAIAGQLLLTHKDFIDAKLSIPDKDRGGL